MYKLGHESKGAVSRGINTRTGYDLETVMWNVLSVVGDDIISIIPPGYTALFFRYDIETSVRVAGYQCSLENMAPTAAGVKASLLTQSNDHTTVIGLVGDGATMDIGIQVLSGVMGHRNEILYICCDNEAYMNTRTQGNSSTPMFASTTTTPVDKHTVGKDLVGIAMAHDIPYATTANISNLTGSRRKVQKVRDTQEPSLVYVHAPYPIGWRCASSKTVEAARKAAQTGYWALHEYEDGRTTVNYRPKELKPIGKYISLQGRFKSMTKDEKALMSVNTENHLRRLVERLDDTST